MRGYGERMKKELSFDIDKNTSIWLSAFTAVSRGNLPICPRCGCKDVTVETNIVKDNIGYVLLTCQQCHKSGYFPRVDFGNIQVIKKRS